VLPARAERAAFIIRSCFPDNFAFQLTVQGYAELRAKIAASANIQRALRDIYRKLLPLLHPPPEPTTRQALALLLLMREPRGGRAARQLSDPRVVSAARWLAWLGKMARSYSGNLLWLVGGLPALVATVSTVGAAISYVFFYLPFRAASRNPRESERHRG
jgi:hypothetical protein